MEKILAALNVKLIFLACDMSRRSHCLSQITLKHLHVAILAGPRRVELA